MLCTYGIHQEVRAITPAGSVSLVYAIDKSLTINRRQRKWPLENEVLRDQIGDSLARSNRGRGKGLGTDPDAACRTGARLGTTLAIDLTLGCSVRLVSSLGGGIYGRCRGIITVEGCNWVLIQSNITYYLSHFLRRAGSYMV